LEDLIVRLQEFPTYLVYFLVFLVAYVENIFPPAPSDLLIVFAGSLAGIGHGGLAEFLIAATLGSTMGFLTMFKVGRWFGRRILDEGRLAFLPRNAIHKIEGWFQRFGYWVIVGNRFLAGTRAVVSFCAGVSELDLTKTLLLSFLSSLVWNTILISSGYTLGTNWRQIGLYLSLYWQAVTAGLILLALGLIVFFYFKQQRSRQP
jgi:membrane protein DedA with SNARE-associated domain